MIWTRELVCLWKKASGLLRILRRRLGQYHLVAAIRRALWDRVLHMSIPIKLNLVMYACTHVFELVSHALEATLSHAGVLFIQLCA